MPSYFYECRRCCRVFTLARRLAEYEEPASCPDCGETTTKRVIFGPFFARKGDARRTNDSSEGSPNKPTSGKGPWTAQIVNCVVDNCDTGIKVSGNSRVFSDGLKLRRNRIGIDVDGNGEFRHTNTDIE